MDKIINIVAVAICLISVIFNWGYYFGKSDTSLNNLNDRLLNLEKQTDEIQSSIKNIDNQVAYIRGYLSKQISKNTSSTVNFDQAIKASAEQNLAPQKFDEIFTTINSMPAPLAKKYLQEKNIFSNEQINAILKNK
jgi:peptidoglycan hydrolase CwlO-like protein